MSLFVKKPNELVSRLRDEAIFPTNWLSEMSRAMDSFMNRGDLPLSREFFGDGTYAPALNVSETPSEYKITAELPGMKEQDIELQLQDNSLILKGEKKHESEEKDKNFLRIERSYGSFYRRIPFPARVNPEKVEAKFKEGVLAINIAKADDTVKNTRRIDIRKDS
jgi:HSP20 family protein